MTTKITEQNISQLANAGVNWQPVVTADGSTGLTAVAGRGYFIDTTSGAQTITLPASPNVGDVVVLKDYARTWATNNVTIASTLLDGITVAATFSTSGQTVTLVRMDNTKGWSIVNEDTTSNLAVLYVAATGGTVTESGDFKIHTFTGDGCFVVSCAGNPNGSTTVDYLVVAGGGGGGACQGGGGGAGGFRTYTDLPSTSPLNGPAALPVSSTTYPITVGGGGAGTPSSPTIPRGAPGSPSTFSTITSAGGGGGGTYPSSPGNGNGLDGGSGGGAGGKDTGIQPAGAGNTPPVAPPQGNNGASITPASFGSGGGGAGSAGGPGSLGGAGSFVPTDFFGPTAPSYGETGPSGRYFSGGGGGRPQSAPSGTGGLGGGGDSTPVPAKEAIVNTGGGGAGGGQDSPGAGGTGGSGIVIIRYKFQ
jgi:hypothetical protein